MNFGSVGFIAWLSAGSELVVVYTASDKVSLNVWVPEWSSVASGEQSEEQLSLSDDSRSSSDSNLHTH